MEYRNQYQDPIGEIPFAKTNNGPLRKLSISEVIRVLTYIPLIPRPS